jgi:hypothetical protein
MTCHLPFRRCCRPWIARSDVPVVTGLIILALVLADCGAEKPGSRYEWPFPGADALTGAWTRSEVTEYRDSTIFDFLDGGAELYLDYGTVAVASARYDLDADRCLDVSVYDMGRSENAFGIYTNFRYPGAQVIGIGNEAIMTAGALDFWKGRYYCKVVAFDTSPEVEKALLELARALAANIPEPGAPPALMGLLSDQNRIAGTEKYFRTHLTLNNIYYVDAENVLNLTDRTEGATAVYDHGGIEITGFIIRYPTGEEARSAYASYESYLAGKGKVSSRGLVTQAALSDGRLILATVEENFIVGAWDVDDVETGLVFVDSALARTGGSGEVR